MDKYSLCATVEGFFQTTKVTARQLTDMLVCNVFAVHSLSLVYIMWILSFKTHVIRQWETSNQYTIDHQKIIRWSATRVLSAAFPSLNSQICYTPVYVHSYNYDVLLSYSILLQEPGPFLILILDKTLVTGPSSTILIVLGRNHDCLSATSQESAHQMVVVETMMLECAVSHVRMTNSSLLMMYIVYLLTVWCSKTGCMW